MTWDDLLVYLREDILHDRSDRIEGDDDKLWSDDALARYLKEAHRRFARRSYCIRDGSSPVTLVTSVLNQREYALDPSIMSVVSARWIGSGNLADPNPNMVPCQADLGRVGHSFLAGYRQVGEDYFDPSRLEVYQPGRPLAFSTDEETTQDSTGSFGRVMLRLYPVPSSDFAGGQIQLRVVRVPLTTIDLNDLQTYPEVPEDYHLALCDYAAYLALRIVDHELGDPARAAEMKASFDRQVEEAKRESFDKLFAPEPWGFGRNGYSYVGN